MRALRQKPKASQPTTSATYTETRRAHSGPRRQVNWLPHSLRAIGNTAVLAINKPRDTYEQEADRLAEHVTRTPASQERVQTRRVQAIDSGQVAAPPIVHDVLRSPGQPLDPATRAFMEPRFGDDVSRVRVHADGSAAQSARSVNAHAYTVGRDIVFGAGRFAPDTKEGQHLIAHELTHVAQQRQGGAVLQRQPAPNPPATLQPFVPADQVRDLRRGPGEEWRGEWIVDLNGHTSPESAGRALWPQRVPLGVEIRLEVALIDPIERGTFKVSGIDDRTLKMMEPSIAKLFTARLAEEHTENKKIDDARTAFRKRHHGLGDYILSNIDFALKKATKGNPDLRLAFYRYYASAGFDDLDSDSETGVTSGGDTEINRKVLELESKFATDDPVALLAGTLIHEFVHTPQGGADHIVASTPKEAKAYAIELFFAERMGDQKRADVIYKRYGGNDPITQRTGGYKIFNQSHYILSKIYEVIDRGDSAAAAKARAMSVEFISKNADNYGPELRAFIAKHAS